MQHHVPFLVPVAVAALIATVALSAAAAVPGAGARPTHLGRAASGSAQATPLRPTLPSTSTSTTGTGIGIGIGTAKAPPNGPGTRVPGGTRVAAADGFGWPLSPRPQIRRRFEPPRDQWSRGHRGVDLLAAVGQPALSAGEGVVVFSGVIAGRGVVTVQHFGGLRTTYEPVDERLTPGTAVHRGTRIGVLSRIPGHCVPGTCLHWGAIEGKTYRDPLSLLGVFGRPVLLPLG